MSPTSDLIGWIEVLYNKEYVQRLNIDLEAGTECYVNMLYLSNTVGQVFESFLLQQKKLVIITNHPSKARTGVHDPYKIRQDLIAQGAEVHFYRAPWLSHEKILLIPPGIVYLGSHNFTIRGLFQNHESTVRFYSPPVLDRLKSRILGRISHA